MPRNTDDRDDMRGGRPMRDRMRDEEMTEEGMPPSRGRREEDLRNPGRSRGDRMPEEGEMPLDDERGRGEGYH